MKFISSADNPRYKLWKKLALDSRWSKSSGLCLVAPGRLRKEFLDLSLDIQQEIVTEEHEPVFPGRGTLLPKTLFDRLDTLGTHEPLYIV
ncbi:MAG: hypothetical protein N2Z70_05215, partial [Bdellovibrionaceae bacterium]|nr:hypothetical protein [Pseudobdellovibrionaceae bacterium]